MIISQVNTFNICSVLVILSFITLSAQLKEPNNHADYLVITPTHFVETLQPFISWRQSKNLDIKTVELSQIYSEFSDSLKSNSIREFISYTLTYWSDPKPKYILLVGSVDLLPSYKVPSQFANNIEQHEDSVSIDEWYSVNLNESNTKLDISLGRFPVINEQELQNIIRKTITFEDSLRFNDYQNGFTFLTDKTDSISFENSVNIFIDNYLPINYTKRTIFASQDESIENTRTDLIKSFNDGTLFFSYYGHGAPYQWSIYNIFDFNDIETLEHNNLPFIYTAAACSQNFDLPNDSSIVRNLMVARGRGTVASVTSAGLSYSAQGSRFLSEFHSFLFNNPDLPIGTAFLKTKISRSSNESQDGMNRRYTLLGDPALKIPLGIIAHLVDQSPTVPREYSLAQNYPNPFNPSTTIRYSIPNAGFVTLGVYNVLGQKVATLLNEEKHSGHYEVIFNGINLSNGVYFYQLNVNDFSETKKFVLSK